MSDEETRQTVCRSCGTVLANPDKAARKGRVPCPECGSTDRALRVVLTSKVGVADIVTANTTAAEPGVPQFVSPDTIRISATVLNPTISVGEPPEVGVEDLPTEFVADSLQLVTTLLPPDIEDPDGQWVADVGLEGTQIPLGVGEPDDILLAAAEWFSKLVARYDQRRREGI